MAKKQKQSKQGDWKSKLNQKDYKSFGDFVKKNIGNTIPADVNGADVVAYLDNNPNATNVGKVDPVTGGGGMKLTNLVDFFNKSKELRDALNSVDFGDVADQAQQRVKARELAQKALGLGPSDETDNETYVAGDETLAAIGDKLGLTAVGALKVGDRAEELVKKLFSTVGARSLRQMTDEQEKQLFGQTGVINQVVNAAATEYANTLLAAIPSGETWEDGVSPSAVRKVFTALANAGAKPVPSSEGRSEDEVEREVEKVTVLIALGIDGDVDDVADEVLEDWEGAGVLSGFQELVAKHFRRKFDAAEIAAGLKRRVGRPSKAEVEARKAAAAATPTPVVAVPMPVKRGPGRPRKVEQPAPPPVKRGPGRPRKAS